MSELGLVCCSEALSWYMSHIALHTIEYGTSLVQEVVLAAQQRSWVSLRQPASRELPPLVASTPVILIWRLPPKSRDLQVDFQGLKDQPLGAMRGR